MNFVYLKVVFAEPKNELSILSSISFSHYESQKNIIFEKHFGIQTTILPMKCINRVGVLINNLPTIHFPINLNSFYVKIVELLKKASIKILNC